ncbi:cryptochrome/photolyase family protein [Phaeacidiphilus oryzae]|uniref:cryptochrome/photolyase family protein n=1 Tax=Phaeacidiphilus oryzae TaxID=348818 RepID=UPI00055CF953|nr:deoxyribodipyrimidine photo-lyase [Phaeacidiphilus oryzae]
MNTAVVVFTGDLRLHDNPVLRAGLDRAGQVVPLFVRDPAIDLSGFAAPNRLAFLADCLADLDAGLRERGGRLVLREGDFVEEVCRAAAEADAGEVHIAAGVSGYAAGRERRLRTALEADGRRLRSHGGSTTVVPPGLLTPAGNDHYAVFSAYHRRWAGEPVRRPGGAPRVVRVPDKAGSLTLPLPELRSRPTSPGLPKGGEKAGRAALTGWLRRGLDDYPDFHDRLAEDGTSRLSAHLHFGTLSPTEVVHRAREAGGAGGDAFVRQLCWRDFNHQLLAARPQASWQEYRHRGDAWRTEKEAAEEAEAWRQGRTGYPIVDAAMRQLAHEGWMHNRARMIVASFLVKTLYVDWRVGAEHFLDLLVDGDIANNQLNWQWVAGTGTDTRPNRVLNPLRQADRFDPEGDYVRHWVPELGGLAGASVRRPWRLTGRERAAYDYPEPVVDLQEAQHRFLAAHGKD